MVDIVTVAERKERETARRRAAADIVITQLRAYGAAHGGRFLIFGSVAENRMSFDSDFDVVIDFPFDRQTEAMDFVENACRGQSLPVDIHLKSTSSDRFLERVQSHAIPLP